MTLHETVETSKKAAVGTGIGIGIILTIVILFRIGIVVKNILFPPKIEPPTYTFNKIPPIEFPPATAPSDLTYSINTDTQSLPEDFPDRLNVYQINHPEGAVQNSDLIKRKIQLMGIVTTAG